MFSPVMHAARRRALRPQLHIARRLASKAKTKEPVTYNAPSKPIPPAPSLAPMLERNPRLKRVFVAFANWMFKKSPAALAGARGIDIYSAISDMHLHQQHFFYEECGLPATFQTWFRITNLHAWLLVVRFRSLSKEHGRIFIQALVTNFFHDVEDRMRDALAITPPGRKKPVAAPERVITRYMKIYREQWNGLHIMLDIALAQPYASDTDFAAAIWRNFLGGRGARGIPGLPPLSPKDLPPLETGKGAVVPDADADWDPARNDVDAYTDYPRLMFVLVRYIRQQTLRLAAIPDDEILNGNVGEFPVIDSTVDVESLPPLRP